MQKHLYALSFLVAATVPAIAFAADASGDHDMSDHDMPGHQMPDKRGTSHDTDDHSTTGQQSPPAQDQNAAASDDDMSGMYGALSQTPMTREASGTSWQPDATKHNMGHRMYDGWMLMGHMMLNTVYDWQDGPRGDEKAFLSGMLMGSARRDFEDGNTLNLRAMLSPDPFMGKSGYPLLLATGETADGVTHLVDRQHPHDLFMELSASFSHPVTDHDSIFLYAGLPGEPAFGPPAFMHRMSIMDSPEAPITHHWFDSTHITFGVLTAGWVHDNWKLEVSQFTGREPDQHRFDIEEPRLDSTAIRASWNPTENLSLQVSWADINSPEQLDPAIDETRFSASGIYTLPLANDGWWSTTVAWGLKKPTGEGSLHAFMVESAYAPNGDWTFFARGEIVENDELSASGSTETVGKLSVGAIRDFHLTDEVKIGIGALYGVNFVPNDLESSYGGDPVGAMVFLRLVASS